MTEDIAAFIAARLDEDEAAAKAWMPFGNPDAAQREHIARHDPARVLREVEAMRAILALHNLAEHYCPLPVLPSRHGQLWTSEEGPCWTLRKLAAIWSDHPDYRAEWPG